MGLWWAIWPLVAGRGRIQPFSLVAWHLIDIPACHSKDIKWLRWRLFPNSPRSIQTETQLALDSGILLFPVSLTLFDFLYYDYGLDSRFGAKKAFARRFYGIGERTGAASPAITVFECYAKDSHGIP
jgi:hypothetical protein